MRPLWLDYQRPVPGRRRAGVVLLTASLIVTGALLARYFTLATELDAVQQQVSRLKRQAERQSLLKTAQSPLSSPSSTGGREETGAAYSSARWEMLFASIEAASDESMTLLGLQPGANEVQITGEAKDLAAAMGYVRRLQTATAFVNTHLTQSEVVMAHPQHPVRFTLVTEWRRGVR